MTKRERREEIERARKSALTPAAQRAAFKLAYLFYLEACDAEYPEPYDYGITRYEATEIRRDIHVAQNAELAASPMSQDRKAAASGGYPF